MARTAGRRVTAGCAPCAHSIYRYRIYTYDIIVYSYNYALWRTYGCMMAVPMLAIIISISVDRDVLHGRRGQRVIVCIAQYTV